MGEEGEARFYAVLGVASLLSLIVGFMGYDNYAYYALSAVTALLVVRGVWESLEFRKPTVDLLMAVVGVILVYHRIVIEGLVIYVLYSIAEVMESLVERLALRRLEEAQRLIPRKAMVYRGEWKEELVDNVKPGDIILVRRGEVVPVDGILLDSGVFNTSMITGESAPVEVSEGDRVESGYINLGDPVRIKAVKSPRESTLQLIVAKAIQLLEEKSRVERLVDRLAPAMIVAVLGVFAPTYMLLGPERSIPILLAGCPSAFIVISAASTSYSVAKLARTGVIVRGGRALESAARCCTIVIDKTGTLTLGVPVPYKVVAPPGFDAETVKGILASVAAASLHPISRAISQAWKATANVAWAKEHPGKGMEAETDAGKVLLGSKRFIAEHLGTDPPDPCNGDVTVYFTINGALGAVCMREEVGQDAVRAVEKLKSMGYRIIIASGDRRERVERLAKLLGIEEFYAEMKPEDKRRLIEKLKGGCGVSMIGDGINDLEAMAASDFGVAVGNIDAVNSVADAVLVKGIGQAPLTYSTSKAYMGSLIQGFTAAALVKAMVIGLGVAGAIPLWVAALLGDDGSTLLGSGIALYRIARS